ncbi:hypothetical protein ZEAMMB73_Zm00001d041057 [Zea mays]|uniref:Uncharacterized protein n=1 Tax=Zea mays TaxID=4577 RepID=A0A1D6MTW1_MAIZE|nr:hypothetical protein ZEAMMB73_Zm00001d041057 [Zea mays]
MAHPFSSLPRPGNARDSCPLSSLGGAAPPPAISSPTPLRDGAQQPRHLPLLRLAATVVRVPSARQNVEGDVLLQHRRRSSVVCCFCAAPSATPLKPVLVVDVALRALPVRWNAEPCGQPMRLVTTRSG